MSSQNLAFEMEPGLPSPSAPARSRSDQAGAENTLEATFQTRAIQVRPAHQILRKVLQFFKEDVETRKPLPPEKQLFLAQVFMHELDEGIKLLERSGRVEQARLLTQPNGRIHLSNQLLLLREWIKEGSLQSFASEYVERGLKLRNNQTGQIQARFEQGRAIGLSSPGYGYKDQNEDALLMVPSRGVLAVMDGMGGHVGGNIASGILVDFLEYALQEGKALEEGIVFAHEAILQRTRNDPRLGGKTPMGSTLVACEIQNDQMQLVYIGDSKLLLIRDGKIIHETQDHTNGQELLRERVVDLEVAHSLNHILSRSLGCESLGIDRMLEKDHLRLRPRDRVLLVSDGITDNFFSNRFSLEELANLASSSSLEEGVRAIYVTCMERMKLGKLPDGRASKPDNLALLLYEHQGSGNV